MRCRKGTLMNSFSEKLIGNVNKVIVGKEDQIELLLISLLVGGHVLLEDVPGTGKTKTAKALAASLDLDFKRVQFTIDLLPSDLTGINFFDREANAFVFRKGPVFTNILRSLLAQLPLHHHAQLRRRTRHYRFSRRPSQFSVRCHARPQQPFHPSQINRLQHTRLLCRRLPLRLHLRISHSSAH